jgi:histidine phosphotransferase ChpT
MIEPVSVPAGTPDAEAPQTPAELGFGETELASHIAAKLCHDFISPAGAIVSGLDLLKDPTAQDMREDAMGLIEASAQKMVAIVHFARAAFGAATTSERFDAAELKRLVEGMFEHMRAEVAWALDVQTFEKPEARAFLNLAYLGGSALPSGGLATVAARRDETELLMAVEARGARARLKPEALVGLRGERLTEGLAGQWIQPFWLSRVVADAKGTLEVELDEDLVKLRVRLPNAVPNPA